GVRADLDGRVAGVRGEDRLQDGAGGVEDLHPELLVRVDEPAPVEVLDAVRPAQGGPGEGRGDGERLADALERRPGRVRDRVERAGDRRLGRGRAGRVEAPVVDLPGAEARVGGG